MIEAPQRLQIRPAEGPGFQPRHDKHGGGAAEEHPGGAGKSQHEPRRGAERVDGDVACPFGIPPAEMTPRVRAAIDGLLGQIDEARKQVQAERDREAYLLGLAEGHPVLPVGNRRHLIRELSRVIARSRVAQTLNTLLIVSIANAAQIRREHGEAAVHALLCEVAALLVASVRASDVVANLAGYDFAVILTLAGGAAAEEKARSLVELVTGLEVAADGAILRLEADWGAAAIGPDDDADAIIAAADRALVTRAMRASG
jgi:diguanylate cyclase (GGDEF)-like protein